MERKRNPSAFFEDRGAEAQRKADAIGFSKSAGSPPALKHCRGRREPQSAPRKG
ncbi:hypothetical protein SBDP1_1590006 [Syntrophobacter sp. SbD1]|nr:hypothetical protein SBDP1_1590006 [Syntrophobacter sp. SbD1]